MLGLWTSCADFGIARASKRSFAKPESGVTRISRRLQMDSSQQMLANLDLPRTPDVEPAVDVAGEAMAKSVLDSPLSPFPARPP